MKLSFVIPAYNEEALISHCLKSVLAEIDAATARGSLARNEVEIIVVNNASTDATAQLAAAFSGVRVVDEPKKGLVQAWAAGFRASSGELVANIDADTVLTPGWLAVVLGAFAKDQNLVALSGPFIYYDLSIFSRALVQVFYFLGFVLALAYQHIFCIGALLQGGNFVVRRAALVQAGGFDTSISFYGEDIDVAKRMSRVGHVRWTFALPVYASGRRLKGEGIVRSGMRYTINNFWVIFFGRPLTARYQDVRPKQTLGN